MENGFSRWFGWSVLFASFAIISPSAMGDWERYLPPLEIGLNGMKYHRSIIHLHNAHSHDACDRKPYKNGKPDPKCIKMLREDLCKSRIDIAFLTEHRNSMAEIPFSSVMEPGDFENLIWENGEIIGLRYYCNDAHVVTMYPGAENSLMPIGLKRHPNLLPGKDLEGTYNESSYEAVKAFHEAGAVVGVNHLEHKDNTVEHLKKIQPDFVEAYNLHANLMGIIEGKGRIGRIAKFIFKVAPFLWDPLLEPDLYYLSFYEENDVALKRWGQLAHEGLVLTGVGGSDTHASYLKNKMFDGERMDGYRRAFRWFTNYILAPLNPTREDVLEAVKEGRLATVFEIFGRPSAVEVRSEKISGSETKLSVTVPKLLNDAPKRGTKIYARWYRASEKGWTQVASGGGSSLDYVAKEPGVYRAEIRINPKYLKKYIPLMGFILKDSAWIYFNPIKVD